MKCEKSNQAKSDAKSVCCHSAGGTNKKSIPSPKHTETVNRHPSPYYYADLFKKKEQQDTVPENKEQEQFNLVQDHDCQSSGKEEEEKEHKTLSEKRNKQTNKKHNNHLNDFQKTKQAFVHKQHSNDSKNSYIVNNNSNSSEKLNEVEVVNELSSPCDLTNIFSQIALNDEDDMTRKRHLYETAFDCSVTKEEGDVDDIDTVCNHPVLMQLTNNQPLLNAANQSASSSTDCDIQNCETTLNRDDVSSTSKNDILSQSLRDMHIDSKEESSKNSGNCNLLLRVYTPSPPSSTPVSNSKLYNSKSNVTSSEGSISNVEIPPHRTKDFRLPIKSLNVRRNCNSPAALAASVSSNAADDVKSTTDTSAPRDNQQRNVLEIKDRTRKIFKHRHKDGAKDLFRYSKG